MYVCMYVCICNRYLGSTIYKHTVVICGDYYNIISSLQLQTCEFPVCKSKCSDSAHLHRKGQIQRERERERERGGGGSYGS